jgi:hypothetical protein
VQPRLCYDGDLALEPLDFDLELIPYANYRVEFAETLVALGAHARVPLKSYYVLAAKATLCRA